MEISREAFNVLLTAIKEGTASILEASGAPSKGLNLTPGTEVSGEVLAKLSNGRYLVRVSGETLDMALPGDTQIGGSLKMTYVRDQPRLTFAVSSQTVKGAEVNISSASRWLVGMSANQSDSAPPETIATQRSARLFDSLPADKAFIAVRLREVVKRSGVFYESHLQQWADGDYPLEELLQEPQGQRSRLAQKELPAQTETDQAVQGKSPDNAGKKVAINNTPADVDDSVPLSRSGSKSTPRGNTQVSQTVSEETSTPSGPTPKVAAEPAKQKVDAPPAFKEDQILPDSGNSTKLMTKTVAPQTEKPLISKPLLQSPETPSQTSPARTIELLPKSPEQRFEPLLAKPESTSVVISEIDPQPQTKPEQPATGSTAAGKIQVPDEIKTPPDASVEKSGLQKSSPEIDKPKAKTASSEINVPENRTTEAAKHETTPLPRPTAPIDARIAASPPATLNQGVTVATAPQTMPAPDREINGLPRAVEPPLQAEAGKQPLQQPQEAELQTQTIRQHTEIPNGKKLPLISPEPPKPDSLLKQPAEVPLQTSKLTPARFEPPDIQTIPVVRQQLEILNTSQFAWQGEAWNGQRMEWTIRREEGRKHSPTPRKWETDLRLELPRLGAISASISITGNQVRLSISASDTDTAEMMKTRKNRLIEGMESCDLVLSGLEVSHDPSP